MPPEVLKYLFDIDQACALLTGFVAGKSLADYEADALLRSAVERQFEIAGEALNQMLKRQPDLASAITDSARIIAFRNVLIHGYAQVTNSVVWGIVQQNLPILCKEVKDLLAGARSSS